jgi:hypothetical protein
MIQLYSRALGSLFYVSYYSQNCGGGIKTRLHAGQPNWATKKLNSVASVNELTIPTERSPFNGRSWCQLLLVEGITWSAWRIPMAAFGFSRLEIQRERKSELLYNWRSVSQYVLVSSPIWDFRQGPHRKRLFHYFVFFRCRGNGSHSCLGFEVFTAVAMKNAVFWDIAPPLRWRWKCVFPPKRRFIIFVHGATSQKTTFFFCWHSRSLATAVVLSPVYIAVAGRWL